MSVHEPRPQGAYSKSYTSAGAVDINLINDGDAQLAAAVSPQAPMGRPACRIVVRAGSVLHLQYANGVTDTLTITGVEEINANVAKILHDTSVFTNLTAYWPEV